MAKKYKHVSGIVVERLNSDYKGGYVYKTDKGEILPEWILQGKDWEEVKERNWWVKDLYDYPCAYGIKSVVRLKDGEVFSVGDEIEEGVITAFIEHQSGVSKEDLWCRTNPKHDCGCIIDYAKKVSTKPQPLFTTEDGVDVFDRYQEVYSFLTKNDYHTEEFCYGSGALVKPCFKEGSHWKHFSTREARNEYILNNKPCLSLHDLSYVVDEDSPLFTMLTDIANRKIKFP